MSVEQADQVLAVRCSIAALQGTIEPLRQQGLLRGVQALEAELQKQRRRERELVRENPAVAETFMRWRKAEALEFHEKQRIALQLKQRRQVTAIAIAARNAAVADLNKTKRKLQELEKRACVQTRRQDVQLGRSGRRLGRFGRTLLSRSSAG